MINKIDLFIQGLDIESSIQYSKNIFNINFNEDEVKKVLPLIKDSWKDYLDVNKRNLFIKRLTVASSIETTNKVLTIVTKLLKFYPFSL